MFKFKSCIYLDNAATSRFKPRAVIRAVEKELKRPANPGRGGHKESINSARHVEDCREQIESITMNGNVVFTKSCTEAINLAIFGSYKGGEIITSLYEHNSVLRPLERLKKEGAQISYISTKSNLIYPEDLKRKITKKTSLVVLGEMSNVTGQIQPIEALGALLKEYGIPFCVDTAQSLGHLNTDYKDVTMLAAPGHKGLHGVQGTGFLVFKNDVTIKPILYGGTGTESANLSQPLTPPEGQEAGTLNTAGIRGLKEAVKWTKRHFESVNYNVKYLSEILLDELKKIDVIRLYSPRPNGVITFNIGDLSSTEVADILDAKYNICVRAGLHCAPLMHKRLGTLKQGAVRASLGYNNTEGDVYTLVKAVKEIAVNN